MKIDLLKKWAALANDLSGDHIGVEPESVEKLLAKNEAFIVLPYGMTAVDCSNIYWSLSSVVGAADIKVITVGYHGQEKGELASPIDIYNFQFYVAYGAAGIENTVIEHRESGSFVYWDNDEEYCLVGGSKAFCETAFPHPLSVMKRYYVDSMVNELENEKYWEDLFTEISEKCASKEKGSESV